MGDRKERRITTSDIYNMILEKWYKSERSFIDDAKYNCPSNEISKCSLEGLNRLEIYKPHILVDFKMCKHDFLFK